MSSPRKLSQHSWMSTTTITTTTAATTTTTLPLVGVVSPMSGMGTACPHCGLEASQNDDVATEARRRINELEAQVQFLSARAAQTGTSSLCLLFLEGKMVVSSQKKHRLCGRSFCSPTVNSSTFNSREAGRLRRRDSRFTIQDTGGLRE